MQNFTLFTAVHFGDNALSRLAKLEYKSVFIIADPFTVKSGLIDKITSPLDSASIKYTIYSDVVPDPSIQKVVAERSSAFNCLASTSAYVISS